MPFQSKTQRRFMYSQHPGIAARWSKETPKGKKLPEQVLPGNAVDPIALPTMKRKKAYGKNYMR